MPENDTGGTYPTGEGVRVIGLADNGGRLIFWPDGTDVRVRFEGLPRSSVSVNLDPTSPVRVDLRMPVDIAQQASGSLATARMGAG